MPESVVLPVDQSARISNETVRMEHHEHPSLWLRPSPRISLGALYARINCEVLTATPRIGARHVSHAKGYEVGQLVDLIVFRAHNIPVLTRRVRVEAVHISTLRTLDPAWLLPTAVYRRISEVHDDLSYFAGGAVSVDEAVSVVEFSYQ